MINSKKNTAINSCLVKLGILRFIFLAALSSLIHSQCLATDYYFHPRLGNDQNTGESKTDAFRTLAKISSLELKGGDKLLLAVGETFYETLDLSGKSGSLENPITIDCYGAESLAANSKSLINATGRENGILVKNASYIALKNLKIVASGLGESAATGTMRVGIIITVSDEVHTRGITLENLTIEDVFYENKGFQRGAEEVRSANGTQKYGWGIRLMNSTESGMIEEVKILGCNISNVSHTGIKLTGGTNQGIRNITISGNKVSRTGGPGIQMSGVKFVYVSGNEVNYSGSIDDSRKWGRGSGLWTWGSSMVLIEKNKFMNANGPGDSAGAHIDFNCDNIVLQYNFSANNAGGFCEILGNNYNCAYRYNISVNDGHRVKGDNGAFQEGKIFWLSGYQGSQKERKGPVNSYFYNNTIYSSAEIVPKIAIDNRSEGILIANNIFHMVSSTQIVAGDQYKPDNLEHNSMTRIWFKNNLYLHDKSWPENAIIQDENPIIGNADFSNPGGLEPQDYIPKNKSIASMGIEIPFLENDSFGLVNGLRMQHDFFGTPINGKIGLGAIVSNDN